MFTSAPGLPEELPGPEPSRWLSTGGAMLPWGADSLGHASRLFRRYGKVVALVRGGGMRHISPDGDCPGTVLACGAEATERAAMGHELFVKRSLVGALHPGDAAPERKQPLLTFGTGLFSVNGDEHRRLRRLLSPVFSRKRLSGYAEKMVELTARTLDTWQAGEIRSVDLDLRDLASGIVTETLLGATGFLDGRQAIASLTQAIQLMGQPLTRLLPYDLPGLPYRSYLNATAQLERGILAVLEARRREGVSLSEKGDMLSALIGAYDQESQTRLSDPEILGHLSVFFAAGHETSANAISWTLFLLASFPSVAARVREELDAALRGGLPTAETVESLEYLGYVVKESLRLFTPAPWNGRVLADEATLGGYVIPRGAEVLVSIYETHRIPEFFERPIAFRPERWETLRPSPYEYNPFSVGPRTCIGAAFATLEIKLVLAMILQRFRLELVPQRIDRFAELVLAPKSLKMKVTQRDAPVSKERPQILGNVYDMVELPVG